jgi:phage regulator Rha-like protein
MSALAMFDASKLKMTSQEIADLVESRHDSVKRTIERLANQGVITFPLAVEKSSTGGRPSTEFVFEGEQGKRDSIIVVAQLSPIFTARLVDRWQELEAGQEHHALPNFSNPAEAARAYADQYEARMLAERTKAEIGSRREATSMATASAAVRKADKLELELDRSKQFATIKRMSMLHHGQPFDYRRLIEASAELGLPVQKVYDANYGSVNAYHADAWLSAYALEIPA